MISGIVACGEDCNITILGNKIKPKHTDVPWNNSASGDIFQIELNADVHIVTFRYKRPQTKMFENYGFSFKLFHTKSDDD